MGRKHDKKEEASIILEILNRIPLSKQFVSVDDILNSLVSADIDVSRRSLQRYLKQMYDLSLIHICFAAHFAIKNTNKAFVFCVLVALTAVENALFVFFMAKCAAKLSGMRIMRV